MKRKKATFFLSFLFFQNLLSGYHGWGMVRLVLIIALGSGLSMLWGVALERERLSSLAEGYKANLPFLEWLPDPLVLLLLTPFQWVSLRYFLVPLFALVLAIFLGARYLQDIYNLSELKPCLRYLLACLFGIGYPRMRVGPSEEGKEAADPSYLSEIGGPGYLDVSAGYAVAIGCPRATSNIYGEGEHFLIRSEKVEEIADLNDQQDHIESISAFSHEGVAIRISDIHFGYHLRQSPPIESPNKALRPYPFSLQALRNLRQSRVVTENGLSDWRSMVKGMIGSTISDFIYQHTVTELLKPPADYNPYADLKKTFQSRPFRERLRKMGTELLWINVGLFDLEKEGYKQELLKTWQPQSPARDHLPKFEQTSSSEEEITRVRAELIKDILEEVSQEATVQGAVEKIRSALRTASTLPTNPQLKIE